MEFVAIDFETANREPSSACQLAAVVVEDGKITEEYSWLIRPPRMYFAPMNIAVHGIRAKDVADAPTMATVWQELAPSIGHRTLVAHNARFDVGVLLASLAAHDINCPSFEFNCTRALAKAAWPGCGRYGLKPLGNRLGIQFQHHDALEDARCCAKIALRIHRDTGSKDLADLESRLKVKRGRYDRGHVHSPRSLMRQRRDDGPGGVRQADRWGFPSKASTLVRHSIDAQTVRETAAESKPLAGKRIHLLGPMRGMDVDETTHLIEGLGATVCAEVTRALDYVVACGTTLEEANSLLEQASLQASSIRVLSERQFLALLPGGTGAVRW